MRKIKRELKTVLLVNIIGIMIIGVASVVLFYVNTRSIYSEIGLAVELTLMIAFVTNILWYLYGYASKDTKKYIFISSIPVTIILFWFLENNICFGVYSLTVAFGVRYTYITKHFSGKTPVWSTKIMRSRALFHFMIWSIHVSLIAGVVSFAWGVTKVMFPSSVLASEEVNSTVNALMFIVPTISYIFKVFWMGIRKELKDPFLK